MEYAVDKSMDVVVNGDAQNIRIRAEREGLPVILFIHGGPGVCDRHFVLDNQSSLAHDFTMVCWDQRGSGKSYHKYIQKQKLSVKTYVDDAEAVIDILREMFGQDKIVIAGHSWGTVIGTALAVRCPQKIAAYVAQGVFVDGSENEAESYNFCVREAERLGDKTAMKKLDGIAPVDGRYPSDKAMMIQRNYLSKFGGGTIAKYAKGGLYLSKALWDDVVAVSYKDVTRLEVPIIVTQGEHDYNTPTAIVRRWYDALDAPFKKWIAFDESAHSPIFEEPEKWGKSVASSLQEAIGK